MTPDPGSPNDEPTTCDSCGTELCPVCGTPVHEWNDNYPGWPDTESIAEHSARRDLWALNQIQTALTIEPGDGVAYENWIDELEDEPPPFALEAVLHSVKRVMEDMDRRVEGSRELTDMALEVIGEFKGHRLSELTGLDL